MHSVQPALAEVPSKQRRHKDNAAQMNAKKHVLRVKEVLSILWNNLKLKNWQDFLDIQYQENRAIKNKYALFGSLVR